MIERRSPLFGMLVLVLCALLSTTVVAEHVPSSRSGEVDYQFRINLSRDYGELEPMAELTGRIEENEYPLHLRQHWGLLPRTPQPEAGRLLPTAERCPSRRRLDRHQPRLGVARDGRPAGAGADSRRLTPVPDGFSARRKTGSSCSRTATSSTPGICSRP